MTTVDEFLAELQAAGLADKTLNELKKKKLHELEKEVERLRAEKDEWKAAAQTGLNNLIAKSDKLIEQNEQVKAENARLSEGIDDLLKQKWCEYLNRPHQCSDPDDDGRPVDEEDYCFVCKLKLLTKPGAGT